MSRRRCFVYVLSNLSLINNHCCCQALHLLVAAPQIVRWTDASWRKIPNLKLKWRNEQEESLKTYHSIHIRLIFYWFYWYLAGWYLQRHVLSLVSCGSSCIHSHHSCPCIRSLTKPKCPFKMPTIRGHRPRPFVLFQLLSYLKPGSMRLITEWWISVLFEHGTIPWFVACGQMNTKDGVESCRATVVAVGFLRQAGASLFVNGIIVDHGVVKTL
jgi:hypothetical protein